MNSEQVANILAFYSYYHPKETVDDIALDFKLPAGLVVNGLYQGERLGLFTAKKQGAAYKEIVVRTVPDDNSDFGQDLERIKRNIYEVITNLNSDEEDITDENLFIWMGAPLIVTKTALQLLVNEGNLKKYRATDPKDPKSKYYFYTLPENQDKLYGMKQFRRIKKKDIKSDEQLPRRKRQR